MVEFFKADVKEDHIVTLKYSAGATVGSRMDY